MELTDELIIKPEAQVSDKGAVMQDAETQNIAYGGFQRIFVEHSHPKGNFDTGGRFFKASRHNETGF